MRPNVVRSFVSVLLSGAGLFLSFVFLMSTCMWGCPNTGVQLLFKVTTFLMGVAFVVSAYFLVVRLSRSEFEDSANG